jgi:hypothetical protein
MLRELRAFEFAKIPSRPTKVVYATVTVQARARGASRLCQPLDHAFKEVLAGPQLLYGCVANRAVRPQRGSEVTNPPWDWASTHQPQRRIG